MIKAIFLSLFLIFNMFYNTNLNTNYNTHTHKIDKTEITYEHSHLEISTSVFIEVGKYINTFEKENKLIQNVKEKAEKLSPNSIFRPPIF